MVLRSGTARRIARCGTQPRRSSGDPRAPGGRPLSAGSPPTAPSTPAPAVAGPASRPASRPDGAACWRGERMPAHAGTRPPAVCCRSARPRRPARARRTVRVPAAELPRNVTVNYDVSGSLVRARLERARLAVYRHLRTPDAGDGFRSLAGDADTPACRRGCTVVAAARPMDHGPSPPRAGRSRNPDGRRCTERPDRALPERAGPFGRSPHRRPSTRAGAPHAIRTPMHAIRAKDPGAWPDRREPGTATRWRPPADQDARRARSDARLPALLGSPGRPPASSSGHTPNRDHRPPCAGGGELRARGRRLG
jgi:hypothetical protein